MAYCALPVSLIPLHDKYALMKEKQNIYKSSSNIQSRGRPVKRQPMQMPVMWCWSYRQLPDTYTKVTKSQKKKCNTQTEMMKSS